MDRWLYGLRQEDIILMKKVLIDASIMGAGIKKIQEEILNPALKGEFKIVLTSLTLEEIENLHNKNVTEDTIYTARKVLDFFADDEKSKYSETVLLESINSGGHIDRNLVKYAKEQGYEVMTSDKGMCTWCRMYKVQYTRFKVKEFKTELPYIKEFRGSNYLYLRDVPFGISTYVVTPGDEFKYDDGYAHVPIDVGDKIIVALSINGQCIIEKYVVEKNEVRKISANPYNEDEADENVRKLYKKWVNYMSKYD